jgi:hypothetical protein
MAINFLKLKEYLAGRELVGFGPARNAKDKSNPKRTTSKRGDIKGVLGRTKSGSSKRGVDKASVR